MAPLPPPDYPNARLSVGFILARRFTLSAFASFIDVLRLSADEGDGSRPILCRWRFISATMNPVTSSCGISLQPDERLGDPKRFDYIVVVGGLIDEIENLNPEYTKFLHRAAEAGIPLIGLCTGAFILHRAGLMDGHRCCVSWFHRDDFLEQFDGLEPVSDQIFVVDRDRITCSGGTSSAHLAAHLVEKHVGVTQARKSLHIMIIDDAMAGEKTQPGIPLELTTSDDLVKRVLLFMQQHMDDPPSIGEICQKLEVGRRKLERRFQTALGLSPAEADKLIRIEHAKLLMRSTGRSVSQVAAETGFCDASHFIKVFKDRNGMTPEAYRVET
ncbi:GlxA family transcriptional regulator [Pelagibius sp. Alg239-R121]|uniref:GlxA family transcriptional regulator n=1 Tax=Pelagibius sp. Alg239-R121 TaxID=2993448 RepID=UPI0024A70E34|nr:GlxA family transcriptional regulator [Pelagibius sp. Alg239-R121]